MTDKKIENQMLTGSSPEGAELLSPPRKGWVLRKDRRAPNRGSRHRADVARVGVEEGRHNDCLPLRLSSFRTGQQLGRTEPENLSHGLNHLQARISVA